MSQPSSAILTLSRVVRITTLAFFMGSIAIYGLTWLWLPTESSLLAALPKLRLGGVAAEALSTLSLNQRLQLAALSLPYLLCLGFAFFRLNKMLHGFCEGRMFESRTVGHLRAFAGLLLVAKLLSLLAMHVRVAWLDNFLTIVRPRQGLNLSSDDLSIVLTCAVFFLIAHMMDEGRRIAEENREFI